MSSEDCENKENKNSKGPASLDDAPMGYLDPNDGKGSCSYPRCQNGTLISQLEFLKPDGSSEPAWVKKMEEKFRSYMEMMQQKRKEGCQSRTDMWVKHAKNKCNLKASLNLKKLLCKNAPNGYEPRFNNEGIGADKHFPASECVTESWLKFDMLELADERSETTFAKWLKSTKRSQNLVEMVELGDAVAGKTTVRQGSWTHTPKTASMTHTPTTDQSCFPNPESFDCGCMATMKRNCRDRSFRELIKTHSVSQCYEFFVCTHSQTCNAYKKRHCRLQLDLLKRLEQTNIKVETC